MVGYNFDNFPEEYKNTQKMIFIPGPGAEEGIIKILMECLGIFETAEDFDKFFDKLNNEELGYHSN